MTVTYPEFVRMATRQYVRPSDLSYRIWVRSMQPSPTGTSCPIVPPKTRMDIMMNVTIDDN